LRRPFGASFLSAALRYAEKMKRLRASRGYFAAPVALDALAAVEPVTWSSVARFPMRRARLYD